MNHVPLDTVTTTTISVGADNVCDELEDFVVDVI